MYQHLDRIPEQLPGEPNPPPATPGVVAVVVLRQLVGIALALAALPALLLLYLPLWLVYGRPPIVFSAARWAHLLRLTWTARASAPPIRASMRLRAVLDLIWQGLTAPFWGVCWLLDEVLYGRELARNPVTAPLLEISAARSGSTQLGHYLEEDPQLAAPSALQALMPFLWLWRLAARAGPARKARFRERLLGTFPPEFAQRHETEPFRTDTLDIPWFFYQLNVVARALGPDVLASDGLFGPNGPSDRTYWERDFVGFVDGLGRRTLAFAGPGPDGRPRRLFLKGHFLGGAPALERRYPDARFLTVVRTPGPRLRSEINFLRVSPPLMGLGYTPWAWLVPSILATEVDYCEAEMAFYARPGAARCVIRFDDYVRDLRGALRTVYRVCLDQETLPPHLPTEHEPRKRTDYLIDRSLEQLGIDEAALDQRLSAYLAWVRAG